MMVDAEVIPDQLVLDAIARACKETSKASVKEIATILPMTATEVWNLYETKVKETNTRFGLTGGRSRARRFAKKETTKKPAASKGGFGYLSRAASSIFDISRSKDRVQVIAGDARAPITRMSSGKSSAGEEAQIQPLNSPRNSTDGKVTMKKPLLNRSSSVASRKSQASADDSSEPSISSYSTAERPFGFPRQGRASFPPDDDVSHDCEKSPDQLQWKWHSHTRHTSGNHNISTAHTVHAASPALMTQVCQLFS